MTAELAVLRQIALTALLLPLFGCAATSLRDAQDHFNKGAELEARALETTLLSDRPTASPGDALAAANEYRMAYATTEELISEHADDLRQDRLLGATYVLQAMALWRISDLQGDALDEGERPSDARDGDRGVALAAAGTPATSRQELLAILDEIKEKSTSDAITLGTRDKVLYNALYGFYDHDGGRAADNYQEARAWFESALNQLEASAGSEVPPGHPVRVYIGSAQLRTLAAWSQARYAEVKRCPRDATDRLPDCPEFALLQDDNATIRKETGRAVCDMEPFWTNNTELKDQLKPLLVPLGRPSIFDEPQLCEEKFE